MAEDCPYWFGGHPGKMTLVIGDVDHPPAQKDIASRITNTRLTK